MSSNARIYAVKNESTGSTQLVKANNQPQALRHIARGLLTVRVPSALEVADLVVAGTAVIDATVEPVETTETAAQ